MNRARLSLLLGAVLCATGSIATAQQRLPTMPELLERVRQGAASSLDSSPVSATAKDRRCDRLFDATDMIASATPLAAVVAARVAQQPGRDPNAILKDQSIRNSAKNQLWIPQESERRWAMITHEEMVKSQRVIERDDLNAVDRESLDNAQAVLNALVASLPSEQPYKFELFLTNEDSANASASPGGIIYISRPAAQGDRQLLTMLLSHEVAHITKRHQTRWLQGRLVDAVSSGEQLLGLMRGDLGIIDRVMRQAGALSQRFARFSADQELESDACAVRLTTQQPKLVPRDAVKSFLDMLEKEGTKKGQRRAGAPNQPISLEQVHPTYEERAATLFGLIPYWTAKSTAAVVPEAAPPIQAEPQAKSEGEAPSEPATTNNPIRSITEGMRGIFDRIRK